MQKRFLIVLLFFLQKSYAQDSIPKTNPIIFIEMTLGVGGELGEYAGLFYGGTANFQYKKNLFTLRYIENMELAFKIVALGTVALPVVESRFRNNEIALLYGKRYIESAVSYSFSAGISANNLETSFRTENNQIYKSNTKYYGFAYELNVKWFYSKKERYRIYMMVPVGKPTSFGRSFGFKLVGNVSEHSYVGIGMTYGFGWHKNY